MLDSYSCRFCASAENQVEFKCHIQNTIW